MRELLAVLRRAEGIRKNTEEKKKQIQKFIVPGCLLCLCPLLIYNLNSYISYSYLFLNYLHWHLPSWTDEKLFGHLSINNFGSHCSWAHRYLFGLVSWHKTMLTGITCKGIVLHILTYIFLRLHFHMSGCLHGCKS